ncbi:hypothetical protein HXX76_001819 [Chlamydomonas incerta]|uniref:Uncharacterized protein n=1 Tax=Chlamydomonas incerta TaxID=51695 RepID=A0A835TGS2_CHLIN|nr:hypothetical protein HXX76_001819 [Chlamydomonas incerta]|eukprot:KAG2443462.1 hypothetical protein HXX76_001819 [Chlamydomonas incerta]
MADRKRREHAFAEEDITMDDADDVFRHALSAHAANMAIHLEMIAGAGPTQRRQLARKTAARVQYEEITAAAAIDEYELEESEEEEAAAGPFIRPRVPALRLPGAAAATAATAGREDVLQQRQQQQHAAASTWAFSREPSAPPHHSRTAAAAPAADASASPPPAIAAARAAAAAAVSAATPADGSGTAASGIPADAEDGGTADASPQLHLPRTEQLLLTLKIFNDGPSSSSGAAHVATINKSTTFSEPQRRHPCPRSAPADDGNQDAYAALAPPSVGAGAAASPICPRPPTPFGPAGSNSGRRSRRGSQQPVGPSPLPPTAGPLSMPPSAAATNAVSQSLTAWQMQQSLAATANTGGGSGAALAPARSAASFGCHRRPTMAQLFPADGAASGLGELGGAACELSASGDDSGGVAVLRSASRSFSGPALRRPPQRRGSMVLLPCGAAAGSAPASQALRPTLARTNVARLARRSDTSSELHLKHPYDAAARSSDAIDAGADPASPPPSVSLAHVAAAGGNLASGVSRHGLRAAAEALLGQARSRSPARGHRAAGSQDWYFEEDGGAGGQYGPPAALSSPALRFASATSAAGAAASTACSSRTTSAASPFTATAAGFGMSAADPAASSGAASPIAQPGSSSAANLFAGMATAHTAAAVGSGCGLPGSGTMASLKARVAQLAPLQQQVVTVSSGEAWLVERTASQMPAGASSGRRLLPLTPSASLSAVPAIGGSTLLASSSSIASPSGNNAMPRLLPSLLQPPAVPNPTAPAAMPLAASSLSASPSSGGVAPLAASATVPSTAAPAAPVGSAATAAAESGEPGCCSSAPLQKVLQPTPPPPTAFRHGRMRASASCYAAAAPGVAADAYAAFAQKRRSFDTGNRMSPAHVLSKSAQPQPLMPPTPANFSAQPATHLLSASSSSASYDDRTLSGVAAAVAYDVWPPQPPRSLLQLPGDGAIASQQRSEAATEAPAAADAASRAPCSEDSIRHSGRQQRTAPGAFAAPPPPARAHAMTACISAGDCSCRSSGRGPVLPSGPAPTDPAAAAAVPTAPDAAAAHAAATHEENANPSLLLPTGIEALESLSCWAGALCDAASASDRVFGPPPAVRSVHSFERTAWVARSREESLGRAPGPAAAALLPAAGRANAGKHVILEEEGEEEGEVDEAAASGFGMSSARRTEAQAPAAGGGAGDSGAAASAATAAGNARGGIMSRMKRALLAGAAVYSSSSNSSSNL